jgi:tryptophan synthase alpha chain
MSALDKLFETSGKKLIGYLPAGYPSVANAKEVISAMVDGGVDAIEVGFPYSDPVMDGPTIQAAADKSLANGTTAKDVIETLEHAAKCAPSVIMTYWNPIERYGVSEFARDLVNAGGSGTITPDLTVEEAQGWLGACKENEINPIFVVAPSSNDQRLQKVVNAAGGFVYAASLMGVTGARNQISDAAETLVKRIRNFTKLPVCVGLGVSNATQAESVAKYADGVIVGSAFINALNNASDFRSGVVSVNKLARELKAGIS